MMCYIPIPNHSFFNVKGQIKSFLKVDRTPGQYHKDMLIPGLNPCHTLTEIRHPPKKEVWKTRK
jgi:hypothetical protein